MVDKLLLEVTAINQKYTLVYQKTGAYFNIFDIAGISSDEVVICKLIHELLDSGGSHCQGDAFLRLFVRDVLKLDFSELDYLTARVHKELYVKGRRIDLCIISQNYTIPIEVKIYAGDQDAQCFDYEKTRQNADLYYLTLDGRLPGDNSAAGLKPVLENGEVVGYEGLSLLSFGGDMVNWVNGCLALPDTIKIAPIREVLLQFRDVLNKLTGQTEGGAKMEIVNTLISSADNLRSAVEISNALPDAKASVMLGLFRELKRLFEQSNRKVYNYDEDVVKRYYSSRHQLCPGFFVEIKKLGDNLAAALCIEAEWSLFFSFVFTEADKNGESCEYIEVERVKSDFPEAYADFVGAVSGAAGAGESTEYAIYWDYLLDGKGRQLDFKTFSPPCVDLADNCAEQAQQMFDKLNGLISTVEQKISGLTIPA